MASGPPIAACALTAIATFSVTFLFLEPRAALTCHVVSYADLDLNRADDAATFLTRIRTASEAACAPILAQRPVDRVRWARCVDLAMAGALARTHGLIDSHYTGLQRHGRED